MCACSDSMPTLPHLATASAVRWWVERVRAGQVVSAGGGPPCETFTTIARSHDNNGPRPLRSTAHPQGQSRADTEGMGTDPIQIGDKLLRFLLEILLALLPKASEVS